jgi:hypothetical protein
MLFGYRLNLSVCCHAAGAVPVDTPPQLHQCDQLCNQGVAGPRLRICMQLGSNYMQRALSVDEVSVYQKDVSDAPWSLQASPRNLAHACA